MTDFFIPSATDKLAWARLIKKAPYEAFSAAERYTEWPQSLTPYQIAILAATEPGEVTAIERLINQACNASHLQFSVEKAPARGIGLRDYRLRNPEQSAPVQERRITAAQLRAWLGADLGQFARISVWLGHVPG
jgi:hypothetical protein